MTPDRIVFGTARANEIAVDARKGKTPDRDLALSWINRYCGTEFKIKQQVLVTPPEGRREPGWIVGAKYNARGAWIRVQMSSLDRASKRNKPGSRLPSMPNFAKLPPISSDNSTPRRLLRRLPAIAKPRRLRMCGLRLCGCTRKIAIRNPSRALRSGSRRQ